MANPRMSLLQLLDKAEAGADPEFLRDGLRLLAQELMETEVTQLVGAQPGALHAQCSELGSQAGPADGHARSLPSPTATAPARP